MERNFWHQKWKNNEIAFHKNAPNPLLVKFFDRLSLPAASRVFLPLCGKTLDIGWLLKRGYSVAGAELSRIAIDQLFAELEIKPSISKLGEFDHYSASNIDVFVGDIFDLSREQLGEVDAIYDRAAFVALPEAPRALYAQHMMEITGGAPQLLICYEFDQTLMKGPPFSIRDDEVRHRYGNSYDLNMIGASMAAGGLKGISATEKVWLLKIK